MRVALALAMLAAIVVAFLVKERASEEQMQLASQASKQMTLGDHRLSVPAPEAPRAQATSTSAFQPDTPVLISEKNAAKALTSSSASSAQDEGFLPSDAKLTAHLSNRGDASAAAAAETFMWGALNRQTDVVANLITWKWVSFTTPTEGAVARHFASVPEPWRGAAATPERLLALLHENELEAYGAFRILGHEVLGPASEQIKFRLFAADGRTRDLFLLISRTNAGWRVEQTPHILERLTKRLREQVPSK